MKLIEKTCPKCGANLEFKPGAKEVKCSYCNKEFIIEGNENNTEADNIIPEDIKLINKVGKGVNFAVFIVIFGMAILIIGFVIYNIVSGINNSKDSNVKNSWFDTNIIKNNGDVLKSVESISKNDQKLIEEKSLTKIKDWNEKQEGVSLTSHKNLGYYLVYDDFGSDLYDVYELNYNINDTNHAVYMAVQYMNINYKNKKLTVSNGTIFGKILLYDMYNLWGYESIKDLYNDIDIDDEEIVASNGLYTD